MIAHRTIAAAAGMAVAGLLAGIANARADVRVTFTESAPKDSFTIENTSGCPVGPLTIMLDMSGSAGRLIFDTRAAGAGVEVYQPFELVGGTEHVSRVSDVADGGRSLSLEIDRLERDAPVVFTIDVDDTLPRSARGQTRVAGTEIEGAGVVVQFADGSPAVSSAFGLDAVAEVAVSTCLS